MKRSREDVLQALAGNEPEFRRMGVRRIGLFSSAARGDSHDASDLDFLVDFERKSFDDYMDLKEFLEKLFGCTVDLVIAENLKPRLRDTILSQTVYASRL
jgi:predicted nucleotidyltransferase